MGVQARYGGRRRGWPAKANLLRLRQELPLLEEERAAVDDGVNALERLLARLADAPTPDGGPSPRQRGLRELPVLPAG